MKTETQKRYQRKRQDRLREFTDTLKDVPCADCGVRYPPYVMDFDHRNPFEKYMTIGKMVSGGFSGKAIQEEAAKCDVVCANCHRERSYGPEAIQRLRNLSSSYPNVRITKGGRIYRK